MSLERMPAKSGGPPRRWSYNRAYQHSCWQHADLELLEGVLRWAKLVWRRVLLLVRAVVAGFLISSFGAVVWSALILTNLSTSPQFPWAVPLMALVLWLLWQYLNGKGWPQSTSEVRRSYLRANPVWVEAWPWAVLSGVLAIVTLAGLWIVTGQLVQMPPNRLPDMSKYPRYVVGLMLLMGSLVAPICEEAGFRGYTQVPLERRYGPVMAILCPSDRRRLQRRDKECLPNRYGARKTF